MGCLKLSDERFIVKGDFIYYFDKDGSLKSCSLFDIVSVLREGGLSDD